MDCGKVMLMKTKLIKHKTRDKIARLINSSEVSSNVKIL